MGKTGSDNTARATDKKKLFEFLETIKREDTDLDLVDENDGLVNSGLIDSLATVELVLFLENEYNIDFAANRIDLNKLHSISTILDLVAEFKS